MRKLTSVIVLLSFVLSLVACGGGGGGGGDASYTVGVSVSGLSGTVVLQNNGSNNLTVSSNGSITFSNAVADGGTYAVTVATQPTGQTCAISNGTGTISGANVTNVSVACTNDGGSSYTVGGSVSGLSGTVVLQNNGSNNLTVSSNGSITFSNAVADGDTYAVTVATQPTGQTCAVSNGTGTISGANITNVSVACINSGGGTSFTVGGTVSGLVGTLILQNNSSDDLTIIANGSYSFSSALADGASYNVSVSSQPANYNCAVSNSSGSISSTNVSNVNVDCTVRNIALSNLGILTESPSVVVMPIHARDKTTGLSVRGLSTSDFKVLEDGVEVGVESFVSSKPVGDVPYVFRIVVAMDISSSILAADIETAKTALQGYINNLQPNQELAIYTFDDVVTRVQNFTSDKALLTTAIGTISRGGPSTNLYGAITTGASQWTDAFSLSNVTHGALVVITDGDDTSSLVTKASAQAAVQNKRAYAIPVGAAGVVGQPLHTNLVDIFGEDKVLSTDDFSVLTNTLDTVRSDLLEYFNGLYYVYYASPARSGTHTIDLSVVGNSNIALDGAVTGSFSATGFSSVTPKVVITGDTTMYIGEPITWTVETEWSHDPANYSWSSQVNESITPLSILSISTSNGGTTGTMSSNVLPPGGEDTITILDNNWGINSSQVLVVNPSRAPGLFNVTNSAYQETSLSWSAVTDATGYKVYWDTASSITKSSNQFTVTANSATHTGLPSGQTYYYRVASLFGEQESGLSTEMSAAVVVPIVINLSINPQPTQTDLSWDVVGTAEYRIYWNTTGNPTVADAYITIPSGTSSYAHTGLDPALTYYYTLVAADATELSTPTSVVTTKVTLSGSVTGLVESTLILQNNGGFDLAVSQDGTFSFATKILTNSTYNVTLLKQPSGHSCVISNDSGVAITDVSNVQINCTATLPSLSVNFGIKQLQFSWPSVNNATYYKLMENPDGVSGYIQVGADITSTSATIDIAVYNHDWPNARYLLSACDTYGCINSTEVFTVGEVLKAIGYIKASNTDNDLFGYSVALSGDGNTLAVGAHLENSNATGINGDQANNSLVAPGAVYLYTRSGGSWVQQAYLKASNTDAGDYFGYSVALSDDGNTLSVGAYGESSNARGIDGDQTNNSSGSSGAVYLFSRNGSSWSQQSYIKASNSGGQFGWSVALSGDGNTLAVGANSENSGATGVDGDQANFSGSNSGAVYLFTRSVSTWSQQAYIKASNTDIDDYFGYSVSLSADGNTLAVGANSEDSSATGIDGDQTDNLANRSGAVYLFSRSGSSWSQQAYVKASNTGDTSDAFGLSVALSGDGNSLAVSALFEASSATGINGNQADNSASVSGAVYLFTLSGSSWTQQAYIKASNTESNDYFGRSVALSDDGNTLAVGAAFESSSATGINGDQSDNSMAKSGAVYLYSRSGSSWSQQTYLKASNTDAGDNFGYSVALSDDGNSLAVGANTESSTTTGINGDQTNNSMGNAGAVYLY